MCDYSKRRRRQKQKSVQLEACSIGVCIQNDLAPRQSQVHAESILGCHLDLKPWGVFIAFFFFFLFSKITEGLGKPKFTNLILSYNDAHIIKTFIHDH